MEKRKGDARIYVVSGLFFACILSGGVFLCLYLILPSSESSSWYPVAGMILVCIPWAFWLLAYLYRCFVPSEVQVHQEGNIYKGPNNHAASPKAAATPKLVDQERGGSPHSPNGGRHVQFGVVTVMGNENNCNIGGGTQIDREAMARQAGIFLEEDKGEESQSNANEVSVASRESERPLTLSSSS